MRLIVGLGNPGKNYAGNRHNLGFMCVSHFARTHRIKLDKTQARARTGTGVVAGQEVVVARPQTYMNQSGQAVRRLVDRFRIRLDDLIVIHDDLDLPVGRIRLRRDGGSAGHRGVNSIVSELGSPDFIRIRVGIGRPEVIDRKSELPTPEEAVIGYVLSDFTPDENSLVDEAIPRVSEALVCLITEGLPMAMNKYNKENEKS